MENVDQYIDKAPKDLQVKLNELRKAIQSVAPKSQEKMSYGMPYYGYLGRLAYFRYSKNHIGLYIPPPIIKNYKKELERYSTSISTIRLSLDKEIPVALIKKLIKARMKFNEDKVKSKL